jgi:diphthamide biosynthesis methyltransferase
VKVIHNASVMNAVGVCGLQLYRYGETISIPFFTETWRPDSFYEKIQNNRRLGLHTLCLLGLSCLLDHLFQCSQSSAFLRREAIELEWLLVADFFYG